MNCPQITMIVILSIGLLFNARDHGKPKTGKDNFWHSFVATTIIVAILIWGKFFN